jgi:hypothetical protein
MNAADDGEVNPEPLSPGGALPLSAPVAGDTLQTRRLDIPRQETIEPYGPDHRFLASPTVPVPDAPVPAALPDGPRYGTPVPAAENPRGENPRAQNYSIDPPQDPHRVKIRGQLDALRVRAENASSWLETSEHYARLANHDGVVPVTARFSRDDIEFLGQAREEVLGFAELGIRLLDLHAPLDAGGISTDPANPILRCKSCMWRWPCPTFRMLTDTLSHLPRSDPPPAR